MIIGAQMYCHIPSDTMIDLQSYHHAASNMVMAPRIYQMPGMPLWEPPSDPLEWVLPKSASGIPNKTGCIRILLATPVGSSMMIDAQIYHPVASNVMIDLLIYYHVSSMMIDPWIYDHVTSNLVIVLQIYYQLNGSMFGREAGR